MLSEEFLQSEAYAHFVRYGELPALFFAFAALQRETAPTTTGVYGRLLYSAFPQLCLAMSPLVAMPMLHLLSLLRNLSNVPIIVVLHVLSFLCDVAVGAVWSMMLGPLYTVCVLLGQDVVDLNTAPRSLVCGSQHCDPIDCVVLMYLLHHAHALVPRA